jgi:predicted  nucleic acid-binding Zn-ribbon protein
MEDLKHERFLTANNELRDFLQRVENLVQGCGNITEGDLQAVSRRLANLAPEIGDAAHSETLDASLRHEVAEYVKNLRALQSALEKVRCVMLTRKMQIESQRQHLTGLQGWVNAYQQTT